MVATAIYSVTMVLWKETAFPLCRAIEKRWNRNVIIIDANALAAWVRRSGITRWSGSTSVWARRRTTSSTRLRRRRRRWSPSCRWSSPPASVHHRQRPAAATRPTSTTAESPSRSPPDANSTHSEDPDGWSRGAVGRGRRPPTFFDREDAYPTPRTCLDWNSCRS